MNQGNQWTTRLKLALPFPTAEAQQLQPDRNRKRCCASGCPSAQPVGTAGQSTAPYLLQRGQREPDHIQV
jgi:hypothetical protein